MLGKRDGATESTIEGSPVSRFDDLGPNSGLAEELYQRYLENPAAVDAHWRDYFDRQPAVPNGGPAPATTPAPAAPAPAPASSAPAAPPTPRPGPLVLDGDE